MDRLREAVAVANIPSLIPVLVQLTGDQRWLEDPCRPTLTTLEVQARYVRKMLQEMIRRDLGAVECRPEVNDAYNERVDAAHEDMVWTHPGMSTYYRNSRGRVVVNSPWRNVDFWHFARDPNLDDFIVERRQPVPVAGT